MDLPGLPPAICALVVEGVWSLYELSPVAGPRYVLLTSRRTEYYFLSSCGDFVQPDTPVRAVMDLELGAPVMVAVVAADRGALQVRF